MFLWALGKKKTTWEKKMKKQVGDRVTEQGEVRKMRVGRCG